MNPMRSVITLIILNICVGWLLVAPAVGQTPAPAVPPTNHAAAVELLDTQPVQVELGLNPDQREQVGNMFRSMRADFERIRSKLSANQQTDESSQELKTQAALLYQKYRDQLNEILSPEQRQRLKQLSLRLRGLASVLDDDISQALQLTDEQTVKIQDLVANSRIARTEARRAPRPAGKVGRQIKRVNVRQVKTDYNLAIQNVLTPDQLAVFDKMLGGEFDFSAIKPEEAKKLEESIQLGDPAKLGAEAKQETPKPVTSDKSP